MRMVETWSPKALPAPGSSRDDKYFLEFIFFKVEDTTFQVPRHHFSENEVFSNTFKLPSPRGGETEGSSEGNPFELLGILKKDFRPFLCALYPLTLDAHQEMDAKEWTSVLALSDMWGFQKFRELSIRHIWDRIDELDHVESMILGEEHNVPGWFFVGCASLIYRDRGPQPEEIERLGVGKSVQIYELREMKLKGLLPNGPTLEMRRIFGELVADYEPTPTMARQWASNPIRSAASRFASVIFPKTE